MRRLVRRWFVPTLLLMASIAAWQGGPPTHAASEWSDPVVLFNTNGFVTRPVLAADAAGDVHLLFPFNSKKGDATSGSSGALMYARLHQGVWSRPFDVLVSPDGDWVDQPAIAVDKRGYLHVVWKGGPGSKVQYSRAHVTEAGSAAGWTPVEQLAEVGSNAGSFGAAADIVASADDSLNLVYPGSNGGIQYRRSIDGGYSWLSPATVADSGGSVSMADDPRIATDDHGRLYVTWTEFRLPNAWPPAGTFYSRSLDDGLTWSPPLRVASENRALLNVAAGRGLVHRVWHATVGIGDRKHQWSSDGGHTWSPPVDIGPTLKGGLTGYSPMAFDSAGTLHLVTATNGVYHVAWDRQWSSPTLISQGAVGARSIEHPSLAVSRGNLLHVVYEDDFERIWYTGRALDVPASPVQELPPPDPPRTHASSPPRPAQAPVEVASARASAPPLQAGARLDPTPIRGEPIVPIVAGVLPVALLVGALLLVRMPRRSRD